MTGEKSIAKRVLNSQSFDFHCRINMRDKMMGERPVETEEIERRDRRGWPLAAKGLPSAAVKVHRNSGCRCSLDVAIRHIAHLDPRRLSNKQYSVSFGTLVC
ncbi:hypothetical protein LINGRAHAP2_LOCUS10660 [Linum grandiflorum]